MENGNVDLVRIQFIRFLIDVFFIVVRNVNFGYIFGENIVSKLDVEDLRLFVIGENLLLFSKRDGLNLQYNLVGILFGNDFNFVCIIFISLNVNF